MTGARVLLTGATGFIGSTVLDALSGAREGGADALSSGTHEGGAAGVAVTAAVRTPPTDRAPLPGVRWARADLTDPASLRGLGDGCDVLLHLAARVGGDARTCAAVNVDGTAALLEEARRAGIGRVVLLSTAAVYGAGPHSGIAVDEIAPEPVSDASRTRLAAERLVLAAGGTVLRPGLVLGTGDRWVVPALAELVRRVPARWDGGRGLLSVVDVHDLARLIATLARAARLPGGTHHASHPEPVRVGDLLTALAGYGVLPEPPARDWPMGRCLAELAGTPGRVSERQFRLLAEDHWYDSGEIWRLAGCVPGAGPTAGLADAAPWYRSLLAGK
ncbi:NAD-dependent epimerase/dehydratase family protein [Streptomyces sp. CRN 30]|uniref:NAD-dependent epimerase/dehydratase family protein n=1 Tax=Streptomyces sp. CRN 30 TaxID=3075613 RepID=UPI002A803B26|nr:NAD-dependent epimerase/dehydratase family protein [Streptomyces sp. CRN 30]